EKQRVEAERDEALRVAKRQAQEQKYLTSPRARELQLREEKRLEQEARAALRYQLEKDYSAWLSARLEEAKKSDGPQAELRWKALHEEAKRRKAVDQRWKEKDFKLRQAKGHPETPPETIAALEMELRQLDVERLTGYKK